MSRKELVVITFADVKYFDKPMASPRPRGRVVRLKRGYSVQMYMPTQYKSHKQYIRRQMPKLELQEAVKLDITFGLPIPASVSKKKADAMMWKRHAKKPDLDNLLKTVLDAANGTLWKDDGQVAEINTRKIYTEVPIIKIEIETVDYGSY